MGGGMKLKTFEEYWMEGVVIHKGFEGEKTFENCSKYFDLKGDKAAWDYCEKQYKDYIKKLEQERDHYKTCYDGLKPIKKG